MKFNYTMSSEKNSESSLFYMSTISNQYMNLKIIDNTLFFEWKLGNKPNQLKYDLAQSDSYEVNIQRFVIKKKYK